MIYAFFALASFVTGYAAGRLRPFAWLRWYRTRDLCEHYWGHHSNRCLRPKDHYGKHEFAHKRVLRRSL